MKILRAALILLASLEGGWITFDGAHALHTGEYLKPRLGAYGGRVGEWTRVASALGAISAYAPGAGWAWWALFVFAGRRDT